MKYINLFIITLILAGCSETKQPQEQTSKYAYESVENDPLGLRIYTLDNGLKVYISVNKAEPRVQTNIAVRTGSKQDPADATGLAHYLEHMLFKGTSNLGSLDWEKEQAFLNQISDQYELLRSTEDDAERKVILQKIDELSGQAAEYVAANEYDKLISSMGAQGTNAYTSNERTVYINDIPSNEIERWLALEAERFSELTLRLFHTELEAVYEEFNRSQDSDFRQGYYKVMDLLFPVHPYGQQTTIGTGEHLKNPSMEKIHEYFKARYVPNNMAIVLAGDIDPDATMDLVVKYFGGMEKQLLNNPEMPKEEPISEPRIAQVSGADAEFEMVAFRLEGSGSKDDLYLELMDGILSNGTAGLIDINLNQSQKVLRARSSVTSNEDYSYLMLSGNNRQGQTLEEVRNLLLEQVELAKNGEFEDWMIAAVVRKFKRDLMGQMEANWIRAYLMSDAFILDKDWNQTVTRYDRMAEISKEDFVAWAKEKFSNNYVAVDKVKGEKDVHKVAKPEITQVPINRDTSSAFFNQISEMPSSRLEPQFVDFEKEISRESISDKAPLLYVKNEINELYQMYYVFDMGSDYDPMIPLAFEYLPYLGTNELSPADIQKELFRLGVDFNVFSSNERSYVIVNGLAENFEEGVKFFENLMGNAVADQVSYDEMVNGMLKKRSDKKLNKGQILFGAMGSYAKYGEENPFNTVLTEAELRSVDPNKLTEMIKNLKSFDHRIMYYGPQSIADVDKVLESNHALANELIEVPRSTKFQEIETTENRVYFAEYDMVQTELMMYHRGPVFDMSIAPESKIFGEYFGGGLSSIVFQEIRESRALAYSAYAGFTTPGRDEDHHYVRGYIGTQANKLNDATSALLELMSTLPKADAQFEQSKLSAQKQIETNRTTGSSILWAYQSAMDRGLKTDMNQVIYPKLKDLSFDQLQVFFDNQIKDKTYTYVVIGKKSEMDMTALEKLGPVQELTLEELFGY